MSVAIIGSSGGGVATLGHNDSAQLLRTIHQELQKIDKDGSGIAFALYVSLRDGRGFDTANAEVDRATLYSIQPAASPADDRINNNKSLCHVEVVCDGLLKDVNEQCRKMDLLIANAVRDGRIQGIICISCDVELHSATLTAAAACNIPVTGSGGTSLSAAVTKFGVYLVGNAGGSVATTSYTRAVSYTHALATVWKCRYRAFSSTSQAVQWRSVLNACLPVFWSVCLAKRVLVTLVSRLQESTTGFAAQDAILASFSRLLSYFENLALPTACCVVMATSYAPQYGSTAVLAASVAAMTCHQSVLGGLLTGWLVTVILGRALYLCVAWGIPATMSNLVVAGGVGVFVATLSAPMVPILQLATSWTRWAVRSSLDSFPGAGFVAGCMFCYGSKVGAYHALYLPIILIEMEQGDASFWGAIDECTLVMVSAGVCAANILLPTTSNETSTALCRRGLRINLLCGDFIEVAYPFMEQHPLINLFCYLASGFSTEILSHDPNGVLSSAYLPVFASIWLAEDWHRMAMACCVAFGFSFLGTVVNNVILLTRSKTAIETKSK